MLAAVGGGVFYLGGVEGALARLQSLRAGGTQVTEVPPAPEPVPQQPMATPSPEIEASVTPERAETPPAPVEVAAPEPAATPAPTPAPPTPAPPAAGTTPPSVDAARAALRGGRFADAGRGFATHLRGAAPWTVQVLVACSTETLDKAIQAVDAPELYVLPVTLQGRACFRVCWGLCASEAQAGQATSQVPRYFIENGARPRVVRSETLF
jgi:septal ring-binding cell division protein DamX